MSPINTDLIPLENNDEKTEQGDLAVVPGASVGNLLKNGNEDVEYSVYEVSRHGLKITTTSNLLVGTQMTLTYRDYAEFSLFVVECSQNEKTKYNYVHLIPQDKTVALDLVFSHHSMRVNSILGTHFRTRNPRIPVLNPPLTYISTFGAIFKYKVRPINASRSGVLLEVTPGQRIPFRQNGLIECDLISMMSGGENLGNAKFLGRVRRIYKDEGRILVAVMFSESDHESMDILSQFLTKEEERVYLSLLEKMQITPTSSSSTLSDR